MNGIELDSPMPHIVKTIADKYHLIDSLIVADSEFHDQIAAFNPSLLPEILNCWIKQVQVSLSRIGVCIPVEDLIEGKFE